MITEDTISLDTSESGFVKVQYVQIDDGIDMGGRLCIEQASVLPLVEMLGQCLNIYGQGEIERRCGNDSFQVYESGHEMRPFYNILNRRADDAPNSGLSGLMMTKSAAEDLISQLLKFTAQAGDESITKLLSRQLLEAAASGDLNAMGDALTRGADVNAHGLHKQSALNKAAESGHLYAVAILLAAGAHTENFDVADKSPLMAAAFAGKTQVVELLLRYGAVINRDLLNTLKLKIDILEENAEAGVVSAEEATAWQKFLDFMIAKWHKQNEMASP
ncbi:MAG TPA: ankyrin repeat domain-containing protein [Pyrinomonadaceae bacterium]|jgi:hypothetical protein